MFANLHDVAASFTFGRDGLLIAEQPNFDVQMLELAGGDRGETMVVRRGPLSRMHERLAQRHFLAEKTAAAPELALTLQAHKCAQHRHAAGTRQISFSELC